MPASAIRASAEGQPMGLDATAEADVSGPDGLKFKALTRITSAGSVAVVEGDVVPGVYRIAVPPTLKAALAAVAGQDGTIPFTVTRDPAESTLAALSDMDIEFIRKHTNLLDAKALDDVLQVLTGKAFGEELWRPLAVAALFLLLAEILLTRWIACQRRTGQDIKVEFEELGQPSKAFREQLGKVKAGI
jgi:hypothetical protein